MEIEVYFSKHVEDLKVDFMWQTVLILFLECCFLLSFVVFLIKSFLAV